ncbi:MAG TPA: mechanosensitive ion channel domain-containing protein [Rhodopila sp.]|nr:mechanosensitive ion channel domain-containing protein [Rhodopila sp.]
MSDTPSGVPRGPAFGVLVALGLGSAGAWLLYWQSAGNLLLGDGPVRAGLHIAAIVLTALLCVQAGGRAILGLGVSHGLGVAPTGLQRAIAYGLLTFAASGVVLSLLGFDITAVLTTSAIVTAAVGLALQPTLASLVSGLALHVDRVVRVGDAILLDGQRMEVTQLDWRTVSVRRRDGLRVVIPNARIGNEALVTLPAGAPMRQDTRFDAPITLPPQRITELVRDLIVDFPQVDITRPVVVMLENCLPEQAAIQYIARYWVRNPWDAAEIASEVLRRIWYLFHRHGIAWPASRLYAQRVAGGDETGPTGPELQALVAAALPAATPERASELVAAGQVLLYAPGERVILPSRCTGHFLLILAGAARPEPGGVASLAAPGAPPLLAVQRLGRSAQLRQVADALARHIGPYAEHAVRSAAEAATTLRALCEHVALEIEDPVARAGFLAEVEPDEDCIGPGSVFMTRREPTGRIATDSPLRADEELAVLAVPPDLAAPLRQPGADVVQAAMANVGLRFRLPVAAVPGKPD